MALHLIHLCCLIRLHMAVFVCCIAPLITCGVTALALAQKFWFMATGAASPDLKNKFSILIFESRPPATAFDLAGYVRSKLAPVFGLRTLDQIYSLSTCTESLCLALDQDPSATA